MPFCRGHWRLFLFAAKATSALFFLRGQALLVFLLVRILLRTFFCRLFCLAVSFVSLPILRGSTLLLEGTKLGIIEGQDRGLDRELVASGARFRA